jgi:Ca2+-transporting ATPase
MSGLTVEPPARPQWHAVAVGEVVDAFGSDVGHGLTHLDAADRLNKHGPNELSQQLHWTRVKRLARQFQDVLIWLLLVAAAVSGFVLNAWIDAAAIATIVVLNAAIGYAQESKADRAIESLRNLEAPSATVVREGVVSIIDARDLVPGDVLVIDSGSQVPADARIVEDVRLIANEAPLTGESIPVTKSTEPAPADVVVGDRISMLFAGTTVVSGRGRAIVTATGSESEMGQIAALFADQEPKTPLQLELDRVGRRLALIAVGAAILIFGAGLARSFPIEIMILTAVAVAVAAIPEGLPAVVTVSLAGGLQRLAHRNAVVRRLPAVETLGAVNVICTDKTGTLTAAELQVGAVAMADGRSGLDLLAGDDAPISSLVATAALCNDAYLSADGLAGDPTEVALLVALERVGIDYEEVTTESPRIDEAGFDGRRKRMSTLHALDDGYVLRVKGAPEILLARSSTFATRSGTEDLTDAKRALILTQAETLAKQGMRTLGFAEREIQTRPVDPTEAEESLCFIGMVGFNERIRPEVPTALQDAARAGVTTVMVTGDHATTAQAVADAVGLERGGLMQGHDLSEISAEDLSRSIGEYRVFARVDPADKVKIIEAWRRSGATVAMTGDGVNDAPALHRADIGVAMGSGTDVARESAAMILTDDNYATIVSAIAEGRRLFNNLRNVVHYLLSANASEVLYVLAGFLIFGFLGEPILAVQLLWINLLSDALPAIALGMDASTRDVMRDMPGRGRDILSRRNTALLLVQGTLLAIAALLAMLFGSYVLDLDQDTVRTMAFSTLVFSQLLHALSVRAAGGRMRRPGPLMTFSLLGSAILQFAVVYSALGNQVFHTSPLNLDAMLLVIGISILSMVAIRLLDLVIRSTGANR